MAGLSKAESFRCAPGTHRSPDQPTSPACFIWQTQLISPSRNKGTGLANCRAALEPTAPSRSFGDLAHPAMVQAAPAVHLGAGRRLGAVAAVNTGGLPLRPRSLRIRRRLIDSCPSPWGRRRCNNDPHLPLLLGQDCRSLAGLPGCSHLVHKRHALLFEKRAELLQSRLDQTPSCSVQSRTEVTKRAATRSPPTRPSQAICSATAAMRPAISRLSSVSPPSRPESGPWCTPRPNEGRRHGQRYSPGLGRRWCPARELAPPRRHSNAAPRWSHMGPLAASLLKPRLASGRSWLERELRHVPAPPHRPPLASALAPPEGDLFVRKADR